MAALAFQPQLINFEKEMKCRFCGLVYIDQMIHSKTLVRAHLAKHKENKLPLPENFPDQPESGNLNSPRNMTLNGSFNPTFNSTRYGALNGSFTGNMNNTEVKKTPTGKGNFKNTAYSLSKSTSSNDNEVAGKFKIKCPICQEVPAMNNKSDGKSFRFHVFTHFKDDLDSWDSRLQSLRQEADLKGYQCDRCPNKVVLKGATEIHAKRSTICHLAIMHHELRTILDNDERFDEEFISNIFKDVEDSNEFSTTTKENFEKNDSKVDNTAGGQELKNKDIDFTENVDEDLEKLPPTKKLNKIDDDDEEMSSTENPTKYYSALDSTDSADSITAMASDSNPKSDLENSESQNETTSPIQEISPDEKLSEEYFHCSICKTKHLRVLKFDQLEELRLHLAQDHFNELILKDLKEQLLKNPVCPMNNCESLFNQLKLVEDHFASSHQEENFDMTNAINKCQNCYQGPFPTFTELLKHLAFNHPESIDKFTNKLGLSSTLKPITDSNEDVPMDGTGVPEEEISQYEYDITHTSDESSEDNDDEEDDDWNSSMDITNVSGKKKKKSKNTSKTNAKSRKSSKS